MNPLSTCNFFRHNKRKFVSNMIIIVVAICFVYAMECFVASIVESIRPLDATRYKQSMAVFPTQLIPQIPQTTIESLKNNKNIEHLLPITLQSITFKVPGSIDGISVYGVNASDRTYLFKKFNVKLKSGRLPEPSENEIAVDKNIALNSRLKIGSHVGNNVDKSQLLIGDYTVVGILESNSHISIVGTPTPEENASDTLKQEQRGFLVFPKQDHYAQAEKAVSSLTKQGLNAWTLSRYNTLYKQNFRTIQILDMIVLLAIFVMVVCLVCSKYAQYFARRSEIGTLGAIGYTRRELMMRTSWEVILTNLAGFIVGLILAIVLSGIIVGAAFDAVGGVGVYLYDKAAVMSLFAPLFTTLFTLIPVYRMFGRIDAISIIEKK